MGLYETIATLPPDVEPIVAPEYWWDMKGAIDHPLHGMASMAVSLAAADIYSPAGQDSHLKNRRGDLYTTSVFDSPIGPEPGRFHLEGLTPNVATAIHTLSFLRAVSHAARLNGREPGKVMEYGDVKAAVHNKELVMNTTSLVSVVDRDALPHSYVVRYQNCNEGIGGYLELTARHDYAPDWVSQMRLLKDGLSVAHFYIDGERQTWPIDRPGFAALDGHLAGLRYASPQPNPQES